MMKAGEAKLAKINAQFDAARPISFRGRVMQRSCCCGPRAMRSSFRHTARSST